MEVLNVIDNISLFESDMCEVVDGSLVYRLPTQDIEIQRRNEVDDEFVEVPTKSVVRLRFKHGLQEPLNYNLKPRLTPGYVEKGLIISDCEVIDDEVEVTIVSIFANTIIRNEDQVFVLRLEPKVWVRNVELPEGAKSF